jgi:serine/threonine-protein kinase
VIDSFVLEAAIGEGGMGAVYRALDTKLERHVALKLLPPDQANDAEVVQRFYHEGRAAAQLDDENIARVFSIGKDGVYHYIAFEYIEGATVRQRVEAEGVLPVPEAVNIAIQIAGALVHASRRGIVHRDIKPSNIILTAHGRAKLVDMGLARRFERGTDHALTQSGMTLGTFDYISPEQARDPRDVDVRSDLYSLGCTLFHMLTGRPPFPGGTVLQKLIQHQEEPPADVRALNPAVPLELATIINKLMAKDRDRRYQSPEHLMRDLLAVAGSVGLAPTHPVIPNWLAESQRPLWEHHLVWLLPVLGFLVVLAGLVWWARELARPASRPSTFQTGIAGVRVSEPGHSAAAEAGPVGSGAAGESGLEQAKAVPTSPRNIPVSSNEDLVEILATAARRSVIILADDGPYWLGRRAWSQRSTALLSNPDLTIKAETGVRPLLKLAGETFRSDERPTALLHVVGGRLTIEGLEFELDAILPQERVAAIRAEGTELLVRGCLFRRTNSRDGRNVAALELRPDVRPTAAAERLESAGERPPAVLADACHFDGGQTAILAQGAADVVLRDCTLGPGEPSIWFENARSSIPVPGELRLMHSSILAGSAPVFRFDGSQTRVWVDDSAIASARRTSATLVAVDNPRNLTWHGRSNLYSRIGLFLTSTGADGRSEKIDQFSRWCETVNELRETGSQVWPDSVWESSDPIQSLLVQRDNPTRVFLLASAIAAQTDVGARQGPFGSTLKNVHLAQRAGSQGEEFASPSARRPRDGSVTRESNGPAEKTASRVPQADSSPVSRAPSSEPPATATPTGSELPGETVTMPTMPPQTIADGQSERESSTGPPADSPAAGAGSRREEVVSASRPPNEPVRSEQAKPAAYEDEDVIRGTEQFLTVFQRLANRGGTLRIAAGADLELPTIVVQGGARFHVLAAPGGSRPRLRYKPAEVAARSPLDWSVLFELRSGSLHMQGLDLVVSEAESSRTGRMAVAGLLPGADLSMADCTITLAVSRLDAAALVVGPAFGPPSNDPSGVPVAEASRDATIRLRDCFLRSGGDGIAVSPSRKLELELANVLVCTEGTLLHAAGGPRQKRTSDAPAVRARIEQITARIKGGLVHLDGTPEEPELATVGIVAANSVMSTANRDEPLFRLDGREPTDNLGEKVRWEGHKVAYDQIKTYRRDEVVETGAKPRIYDREDWLSAFLPKDESPMSGDVKFLRATVSSRVAWKLEREDLRLAPASPLAKDGPDLGRIPEAPPIGDL